VLEAVDHLVTLVLHPTIKVETVATLYLVQLHQLAVAVAADTHLVMVQMVQMVVQVAAAVQRMGALMAQHLAVLEQQVEITVLAIKAVRMLGKLEVAAVLVEQQPM
jgi:hypothetical protein